MRTDLDVIVAGAGIAGLTTALSLQAAGFERVRVVERVARLRPVGVGINLLPHAVRELTELGLGDALARIGSPTRALGYYNRHGQLIWREPRGREAGYAWPQYAVHRGELQALLLDAVTERLGMDRLLLDRTLEHVDEQAGRVDATFRAADGTEEVLRADLLVACDGIHSRLRRQRYPDEGAPIWNGLVLWRGTALLPSFLDGLPMVTIGDTMQKFVAYPLSPLPGDDRVRVNFVAERRAERGTPQQADWNRAVDPGPVLDLFRDWAFDWLDVPGVIAASAELLEYPMVDRDPLARWGSDRTTLVGDAAHAMYPAGSNGASQAVLDARTLAFELATAGAVEDALEAYEAARRPLTTALLHDNRGFGPERILRLAAERAPDGFSDVHDVIPKAELVSIAAGYKLAAGFEPAALAARPSLTPPRVSR